MNRYKKWSIFILLITATSAGYLLGLNKNDNNNYSSTSTSEINLPYKQIVATGVNGDQQRQIEGFIEQFEGYLMQRDTAILNLFTSPDTKEEQDNLSFMLSEDLPPGSNGKVLPRLFTTHGFSNRTVGYYVREIHKTDSEIKVKVDELRVAYSGAEDVGYTASVPNLTLILLPDNNKYKVAQYYHQQPSKEDLGLKYEGFYAY